MTAFDKLMPEDKAALEDAARWWERLRTEPAQELSPEFVHWVSDSRNTKALNAVRDTMVQLDQFGTAPNILDMRRAALTRLRRANASPWPRVQTMARAAAIVVFCAAGAAGYAWYKANSPVRYATQVGERWSVVLSDGSRASLDSDTTIEVRYAGGTRAVKLEHGQARFDVAHDTSRPFIVAAGAESVTAVGTMFNVEELGSKTLITLFQGRVLVEDKSNHPHAHVLLAAGQRVTASPGAMPVVQQANIEDARAWESGHLVFRSEPLGDAVQRINRYAANPITVAPAAASIPISGVFNAGDVGSFISAITGYFPVVATTDSANQIRLERRT